MANGRRGEDERFRRRPLQSRAVRGRNGGRPQVWPFSGSKRASQKACPTSAGIGRCGGACGCGAGNAIENCGCSEEQADRRPASPRPVSTAAHGAIVVRPEAYNEV
jgi:hypothetical protein